MIFAHCAIAFSTQSIVYNKVHGAFHSIEAFELALMGITLIPQPIEATHKLLLHIAAINQAVWVP